MANDKSEHPNALPNYKGARIERRKLETYALNPSHPEGRHKARVFRRVLGFEQEHWRLFAQNILDELPYHEAILTGEGKFGKKYILYLPIRGVNERTASVLTVWIIRPNTDHPDLVTTYIED